jgi:hypothetical protein
LAAGAIEPFVEVLGAAAFQVGDNQAGIGSFGPGFGEFCSLPPLRRASAWALSEWDSGHSVPRFGVAGGPPANARPECHPKAGVVAVTGCSRL